MGRGWWVTACWPIFGWPRAHEDDAERAVRAGLAIVGRVGQLLVGTEERLSARIGIATGQVVVGDLMSQDAAENGATGKGFVIGETPHLAARLRTLAEPGTVVISRTTRRLIGGIFELVDLGPQRLKGFTEPLRVWCVAAESRVEGRFEALRGLQLTPLIGRQHELAFLLERWSWAKQGDGQVVLLAGEPGSASRGWRGRSVSGCPTSRTRPSAIPARPITPTALSIP
jgi:Adenylate and Guanylate cyclase catalytic domain